MNTLDVLAYGQRTIMTVIRQFGPDDWARPNALGVWTARDVVGHLGAFEVRFAEALAPFVGAEPGTNLLAADTETFNDDQAAIRADWTVDAVLAEFEAAHALVMDRARQIPPERWREAGTIPWYGAEYALDDLVVYQQYGHKREHEPQLSTVLERRPGA